MELPFLVEPKVVKIKTLDMILVAKLQFCSHECIIIWLDATELCAKDTLSSLFSFFKQMDYSTLDSP